MDSDHSGYIPHAIFGMIQKLTCLFQTVFRQIFGNGLSRMFFKQLAQIIRGEVKLIRYFFDRNFFGIIQLYVVCRLLYKQIWDLSGIFLFFLFSAQLFFRLFQNAYQFPRYCRFC